MAKRRGSRKGIIGRIFGMLFSVPGLIILVLGMIAVFLVGGKVKETFEGIAQKAKGMVNKDKA